MNGSVATIRGPRTSRDEARAVCGPLVTRSVEEMPHEEFDEFTRGFPSQGETVLAVLGRLSAAATVPDVRRDMEVLRLRVHVARLAAEQFLERSTTARTEAFEREYERLRQLVHELLG